MCCGQSSGCKRGACVCKTGGGAHPASRSPRETIRSAVAFTDSSSISVRNAFHLQATATAENKARLTQPHAGSGSSRVESHSGLAAQAIVQRRSQAQGAEEQQGEAPHHLRPTRAPQRCQACWFCSACKRGANSGGVSGDARPTCSDPSGTWMRRWPACDMQTRENGEARLFVVPAAARLPNRGCCSRCRQ